MCGDRSRKVCFFCLMLVFAFECNSIFAQSLQYPLYGAWRGRAVARDEIGYVQVDTRKAGLPSDYVSEHQRAIELFARTQLLLEARPSNSGSEQAQLKETMTKLQNYKELVNDSKTADAVDDAIEKIRNYQRLVK